MKNETNLNKDEQEKANLIMSYKKTYVKSWIKDNSTWQEIEIRGYRKNELRQIVSDIIESRGI